jgi:hypothetical protein
MMHANIPTRAGSTSSMGSSSNNMNMLPPGAGPLPGFKSALPAIERVHLDLFFLLFLFFSTKSYSMAM